MYTTWFFHCMSKFPEVGRYWHLSNICTFSFLCYSETECSLTRFRSVFEFQYPHCYAVGACTFNCSFVCCKMINILVYCFYHGISVLSYVLFNLLLCMRVSSLLGIGRCTCCILIIWEDILFHFIFCQTFEYGNCFSNLMLIVGDLVFVTMFFNSAVRIRCIFTRFVLIALKLVRYALSVVFFQCVVCWLLIYNVGW
jgi:hypothetical protein